MNKALPAGLIEALARGRRVVLAAAAPDKGIKTLGALCAFSVFCVPEAFGQAQPAYRFIEGLSDRAYDFARVDLAGAALPVRFARTLKPAPSADSTDAFQRRLREGEAAFYSRLQASRQARQGSPRQWQSWVAREQAGVAADAVGKTLRERYRLNFFERFLDDWASGRGRREPAAWAAAGLAGGVVAYAGGVHAAFSVGRLRLGLDARPGFKIERAVRRGASEHLGDARLALKDFPASVSVQYGLASRRVQAERVALDVQLKF